MCWAEKCCYFIPANIGCVCLGIFSFILSTILVTASVSLCVMEAEKDSNLLTQKPLLSEMLGVDLNISSVHILLGIVIIVAVLWMLFSCMLVIGILKNKPSFILSYFSFGIILIILCQLSALLVLLQNYWLVSIILFVASAIHIHFLVVVHTVYELMLRGKNFRLSQDQDDELLADSFSEDISNI